MKPAFSTVACPDWTLDQVAERAEKWGYLGVELRTFGAGSTQFACDPALTAPSKTRSLFDKAGMEIACLATSIRYDEPVGSPLAFILGDKDKTTRQTKGAIDLASQIECPFVRVFAFEIVGSEPRARATSRIVERLKLAAAAARNTGVRLLIENAGSYSTAADLAELLDRVDSTFLGAAYSVGAAWAVGEDPVRGINVLGERAVSIKLKDFRGRSPCTLGMGEVPNRRVVEALAKGGFRGWLVHEYPRAWVPATDDVATVMTESARALFSWMGSPAPRSKAMAR